MSEALDLKYIGTRPIRPDGVEKVTGRADFGADQNLPGMIFGKVARSPHAHARLLGIDTSKAESMPGVRAVITAADFPDRSGFSPRRKAFTDNIIASDKVLIDFGAFNVRTVTPASSVRSSRSAFVMLPSSLMSICRVRLEHPSLRAHGTR